MTLKTSQAIRDKIFEAFAAARTEEQRTALLAMFKATMDVAENHLAKTGDATQLTEFRKARSDDYDKLLIQETCPGAGTWGEVPAEALMRVTNREIAAGRMTEAHPLRKMAVEGAAAPSGTETAQETDELTRTVERHARRIRAIHGVKPSRRRH